MCGHTQHILCYLPSAYEGIATGGLVLYSRDFVMRMDCCSYADPLRTNKVSVAISGNALPVCELVTMTGKEQTLANKFFTDT